MVAVPLAATLFTALRKLEQSNKVTSPVDVSSSNSLNFYGTMMTNGTAPSEMNGGTTEQNCMWGLKYTAHLCLCPDQDLTEHLLFQTAPPLFCVFLKVVFTGAFRLFLCRLPARASSAAPPHPPRMEATPLWMASVFSACCGSYVAILLSFLSLTTWVWLWIKRRCSDLRIHSLTEPFYVL